MRILMKTQLYNLLAIITLGLFCAACDDEGNAIPERTKYITSGSLIKLYNHVSGSPQMNFYLSGQKITSASANPDPGLITRGLAFGSTFPSIYGYVSVPSGSYTLSSIDTITYVAKLSSIHPKSIADELAKTEVKLEENAQYSAFLVGTPAIGTTAANYQILVTNDNLPPVDFSKIYFRFIHTMAGAPFKFDVVAIRPAAAAVGTVPAKPEIRTTVATNIDFKEMTGYLELPLDGYRFDFYKTGTTERYLSYPSAATSVVTPALGRVYTLFLRGTYTPTGIVATHVDYWRER